MASLSTSPRYGAGGSAGSDASRRFSGIGAAGSGGSPRLSSPRYAAANARGVGGDKAGGGGGSGGAALCFDAAALEDPALDIPAFVAAARAVAPLPAVRSDLAAHAGALTTDLIDTMAADRKSVV